MEELLKRFLELNKTAIHPGRGKDHARLVRDACKALGLDEDEFLDSFVIRDKQRWGL